MALPDFLIIGAPKSGTTALHVGLDCHPDLFMSRVKEPKFFMSDGRMPALAKGPGDATTSRKIIWRQSEYEALFDAAPPGALCGESTTLYLRNAAALGRIRAAIPEVRLIAVLRDPIDRAHSNWMHLHSAGLEPESDFRRACALEQQRADAGWAPFWRYLWQGKYGEQVEHLYSLFPREQVLLLMYRDLRERPTEVLDQVSGFLGVREGAIAELPAANVTAQTSGSALNRVLRRVVRHAAAIEHRLPERLHRTVTGPAERLLQREQGKRDPLTADERAELLPYFDSDITLLEDVTGMSFERWRNLGNGAQRSALKVRGRIGTAHDSIDRPIQ